uniref:Uncharacterized protein n=1 Tax=Lotus japonicus TaxID=34305 RepID=I3TAL4_LOTJA|nr:unknown [Lotus japonicus]
MEPRHEPAENHLLPHLHTTLQGRCGKHPRGILLKTPTISRSLFRIH